MKNIKVNITVLALLIYGIFLVPTSSFAVVRNNANKSKKANLVILHTNDTHSHFEPVKSGKNVGLGGVIERAAFIDSVYRADGKRNVLLVHAGDFNQGTSYYTKLGGWLEVDAINAFGYDAIALGNHEFDNGIEDLTARAKKIKSPLLCCNYDFSNFELGKYVKPYVIVRRGGLKIGIIGVLTDISRVVSREISDRLPKLDDAAEVNKWADFLRNKKKCDLVIALTHIGQEGDPFTDFDLVKNTENLDIVIGGHSHTFFKKMYYVKNLNGEEIPIATDGCWGLYMGQINVFRK